MRRLLLCIAVAATLLAGCNGDDTNDSDGQGDETTSTAPGSTVAATTTKVEARDFAFDPKTVAVKAGTPVALRVANKGAANHTFTVDELKVDQEIPPGQEVEVLVQAPQPASYAFYCRFHRGQGMEGTVQAS